MIKVDSNKQHTMNDFMIGVVDDDDDDNKDEEIS